MPQLPNHRECPACHQITLPVIKPDSRATGACCQNQQCRTVVDVNGRIEGTLPPGDLQGVLI